MLARRFESAINCIKKSQTRKCLTFFGAAGRTRRRNATFLSAAAIKQRLDLKVSCSSSHKSFVPNALREPCIIVGSSPQSTISNKSQTRKCLTFFGAAGRTRTDTTVTSRDFKSLASAYSATAANLCIYNYTPFGQKCNNNFAQIKNYFDNKSTGRHFDLLTAAKIKTVISKMKSVHP